MSVTVLGPNRWHYAFSRNIVGHAVVKAGAWGVTGGPGNISVNHCEVMNGTLCQGLGGMWTGLGNDVNILAPTPNPQRPPGRGSDSAGGDDGDGDGTDGGDGGDSARRGGALGGPHDLWPRFTWHGFQHVIVTATGGARFDGRLGSVEAAWTVSELAESATIEFEGPGADLLGRIRDMAKASQLGNMGG